MGTTFEIACGKCDHAVAFASEERLLDVVCPHCGSANEVFLFPALWRPMAVERGDRRQSEAESSCFFHESKRAATPCDRCGRYLCTLCAITSGSDTVCAECLAEVLADENIPAPTREYFRYDQLAVGIAVLSSLFWLIAPLTVWVVLYLVIRHWNTRMSALPINRWRFVVAGLLAVLQLSLAAFLLLDNFTGVLE